jgi:hypothetical protein
MKLAAFTKKNGWMSGVWEQAQSKGKTLKLIKPASFIQIKSLCNSDSCWSTGNGTVIFREVV